MGVVQIIIWLWIAFPDKSIRTYPPHNAPHYGIIIIMAGMKTSTPYLNCAVFESHCFFGVAFCVQKEKLYSFIGSCPYFGHALSKPV